MSKISPCLWFAKEAEQAANFYVSLLPNSRVDRVQRSPVDTPSGKAGEVLVIPQQSDGELNVVVKNFVGLFYVSYTGQPHINGQAGLQGLKSAFNASLGLGNAAGTYFDAQQFAGITELCGDVIFFGG